MNIEELQYTIAGVFEKETDHVFLEQVKSMILGARAEAIRRHIDKYNNVPSAFLAQINCESTGKFDIAECCDTNIGCKVVKSTNKIPSSIRTGNVNAPFRFVGSVDNSVAFTYIEPSELNYILSDRFVPKHLRFYSYINEHIYIFNGNSKNFRVRDIFNDPYQVIDLNDCNDTECATLLNIPDDFIVLIKDMVYRELNKTAIIPKKEEITIIPSEED